MEQGPNFLKVQLVEPAQAQGWTVVQFGAWIHLLPLGQIVNVSGP